MRWVLLGATIAAATVVAISIPRTAIVIYPRMTELSDQIEVVVDTSGSRATKIGAVRGRQGVVVIETQEQLPVQGRQPDPAAFALGVVTFVNRSGASATVATGTELMTASGARYVTTADVQLSGEPDAVMRAPVKARVPGEVGNAGRLEINRVLGALAATVTVLNEAPISGGGVGSGPRVVESDRDRARSIAFDRLHSEGVRTLRSEANRDDILVESTVTVVSLHDECDAQPGAASPALTCRIQGRISAAFYDRTEVGAAARASWRPIAAAGWFIPRGHVTVGEPTVIASSEGSMVLRVPVATQSVAEFDVDSVRELARGRRPDTTRRDLRSRLALPVDPIVRLDPPWSPWSWRVDIALDLNPQS